LWAESTLPERVVHRGEVIVHGGLTGPERPDQESQPWACIIVTDLSRGCWETP
jgi:hypothetical protein